MNFLVNPTIYPFFQILISLILCLGILNFGKLINNIFFKNFNYNFFNLSIGAIILSLFIFLIFLFEILDLMIAPLAILIILLGFVNIKFFINTNYLFKKIIKNENKLLTIICFFFIIFSIISLGPPSMTDATDYHYGVPLNIIKFSTFPNQDVWLHGSLFGYGELINIIPLYLKTDNFFSFFQLLSLVFFFEYFYKKNIDYNNLLFSILFIICTPVILFIISGPKALLFPQLLTTMALYLYVSEKKYNRKNIILISILLLGSTQFKLSFILSSTVIGILVLLKTFNHDKKNILNLIIICLLIFFPKFYYNYNQVYPYNILNIITNSPIFFLEYLSNFKDNYLFYPFNLFVPTSFGKLSTILGFHLLLILFIKNIPERFVKILLITFATIIIHFFFGQQSSRLYFEFILWVSLGFYFLEKNFFKNIYFTYALIPQLFFVLISSLYFAINVFPTFLSLEKRDVFMEKNTSEYSGVKWINENIPKNITVISQLRAISLFDNKVIPQETFFMNLINKEKYVSFLKLNKPRFLVTKESNLQNYFLKDCLGELYKASDKIEYARRNPFNRSNKYKVYIYHFNYANLNYCVDFNK